MTSGQEKGLLELIKEESKGSFLSTIISLVECAKTYKNAQKRTNPFADILFCGKCGKAIENDETLTCCGFSITSEKLIRLVKAALLREVLTPKNIEIVFRKEKKICGKNCIKALAQIHKDKKALEKLTQKVISLTELALNHNFDFRDELNELQKQKRQLLYNIELLSHYVEHLKKLYQYSNIEEYTKIVRASIVDAEGANLNEALRNINVRITIDDEGINMTSDFCS